MSKLFPAKESTVEKKCCDIARADGWKVRKFVSPKRRGACDQFFLKQGRVVFIEFKRPGKEPTELQWDEIRDILAHGGEAYWTDNIRDFKTILRIP